MSGYIKPVGGVKSSSFPISLYQSLSDSSFLLCLAGASCKLILFTWVLSLISVWKGLFLVVSTNLLVICILLHDFYFTCYFLFVLLMFYYLCLWFCMYTDIFGGIIFGSHWLEWRVRLKLWDSKQGKGVDWWTRKNKIVVKTVRHHLAALEHPCLRKAASLAGVSTLSLPRVLLPPFFAWLLAGDRSIVEGISHERIARC